MEKAYRQVPADALLIMLTIIVVWNPRANAARFFLPLCQLVGGKSPPLNFARYAAWLCEVASVLFALPLTHCVDDIIGIEPEELSMSGNLVFKILCELSGWAVSQQGAFTL